jgi:endo-1,4-beta-xylanase
VIITRRSFVALLPSAIGAPIANPVHAGEQRPCADEPRPALRELAGGKGLVIGSAMSLYELNTEDRRLFARELAGITPENALKMGAIRPAQDVWRFEEADALLDFAEESGMRVRGHTLIWNNDRQPAWLQSLSEAEMRAAMHEHIEVTMTRYGQRVKIWDVVNEPIGTVAHGPYSLRDGPFLARLGPDYIAESFRMARTIAPDAKLVLNETHTERDDGFGLDYRRNLLFLIDRLQDAGVPIDGIGLQGHLQSAVHFDLEAYGEFLAEISSRKLFIEVTEADVNDDAFPADENSRDLAVADLYRRYLDCVFANQAVKSLTFWQLGDRASWYFEGSAREDPKSKRRPRPLLFDLRMRPKPALFAVMDALRTMAQRT